MDEETAVYQENLASLGPLPPEAVPNLRVRAPGPLWEGDPVATAALLNAIHTEPPPLAPDGAGGIVPGIPMPLWGGTEPPSRFEPGPRDDWWTSEELIRDLNSASLYIQWPTQGKWIPPEPPPELEDGDGW